MPELPEVETIKKQLHSKLAGQKIDQVIVLDSGRELPKGEEFVRGVQGRAITSVSRRAKLLIFSLADGNFLIGHLKMTGKFLFVAPDYIPGKHDRILFILNNDQRMIWSDIRKFGYLKLVTLSELENILIAYGPEPLETPVGQLAERLVLPKRRKIKAALLDQSAIAGIGNIYADEACFRANILPYRELASLTLADRERLTNEVVQVLTESLAHKGTSANDYVDTSGEKGSFLSFLKVYGRDKEPCFICGQTIQKMVLAGRGTHYCAVCQK